MNFIETAALCECLDLVISVDTSIAHLSAALGQKTWILVPHNPDCRWLLDRLTVRPLATAGAVCSPKLQMI
jgi:ADP-heptose:LPS heptosyltransferase